MPEFSRFLCLLKKRREAFLDRHRHDWQARFYSAGVLESMGVLEAHTREHARGRVLDAGSGRGQWEPLLRELGCEYASIDIAPRGGAAPDYVGDITDMPQVESAGFETVICHQVLEHVRRPWKAAEEIGRVLRPGGRVIVSVPHLSRYHEWPHDYYRFTSMGVKALFEDAGLEVVRVGEYGGVCGFLHHQASTIFPGVVVGIPFLGEVLGFLNAIASVLFAGVDAVAGSCRMPLGVVAVFRKPG